MPRSYLIYGLEGHTDSREGIVLLGHKNGWLKRLLWSVWQGLPISKPWSTVNTENLLKSGSLILQYLSVMWFACKAVWIFYGILWLKFGPYQLKIRLVQTRRKGVLSFYESLTSNYFEGCILRQRAKMKVSCSVNRSWPACIYSAQKQWWSRYRIVLKFNLCWARKLHCKFL